MSKAVLVVVPESHGSRTRPLDLPGQSLLVAILVLVVGGLIEGPHAGWTSPVMLAVYVALIIVVPVFIRVETRCVAPLIDLRAFRHPASTAAVLGAIAVFVAISVTLMFNTFYLQGARGWSPLATGVAVLPIAVGATVCAPVSGYLVGRTGPQIPLTVAGGFTSSAGPVALLATASADATDDGIGLLLVAHASFGIGVGFANAPITITAVSGLPAERAGVAGGITSTARQLGAAVGIAVAGGLFGSVLSSRGDARPCDLEGALTPSWIIVVASGVARVLLAVLTRESTRPAEGAYQPKARETDRSIGGLSTGPEADSPVIEDSNRGATGHRTATKE